MQLRFFFDRMKTWRNIATPSFKKRRIIVQHYSLRYFTQGFEIKKLLDNQSAFSNFSILILIIGKRVKNLFYYRRFIYSSCCIVTHQKFINIILISFQISNDMRHFVFCVTCSIKYEIQKKSFPICIQLLICNHVQYKYYRMHNHFAFRCIIVLIYFSTYRKFTSFDFCPSNCCVQINNQ